MSSPGCSICLSAFDVEDGVIAYTCGHVFHEHCDANWRKLSEIESMWEPDKGEARCAICRKRCGRAELIRLFFHHEEANCCASNRRALDAANSALDELRRKNEALERALAAATAPHASNLTRTDSRATETERYALRSDNYVSKSDCYASKSYNNPYGGAFVDDAKASRVSALFRHKSVTCRAPSLSSLSTSCSSGTIGSATEYGIEKDAPQMRTPTSIELYFAPLPSHFTVEKFGAHFCGYSSAITRFWVSAIPRKDGSRIGFITVDDEDIADEILEQNHLQYFYGHQLTVRIVDQRRP